MVPTPWRPLPLSAAAMGLPELQLADARKPSMESNTFARPERARLLRFFFWVAQNRQRRGNLRQGSPGAETGGGAWPAITYPGPSLALAPEAVIEGTGVLVSLVVLQGTLQARQGGGPVLLRQVDKGQVVMDHGRVGAVVQSPPQGGSRVREALLPGAKGAPV